MDINAGDTVLTLTSGGCNALNLLLHGAGEVVSVDCNPAQSALLELKRAAIMTLPYEDVWQMFGEGRWGAPGTWAHAFCVSDGMRVHLCTGACSRAGAMRVGVCMCTCKQASACVHCCSPLRRTPLLYPAPALAGTPTSSRCLSAAWPPS